MNNINKLFINSAILLGSAGLISTAMAEPLEIVVSAGTKSDKNLNEVAASTIVITEQQIKQSGAVTVSQLLEKYAGFDVVQTGGLGQQTSVFVRGTESDHVLVLIDGVKVNPAVNGIASWNIINTANIKSIEVVKGPRSTLYGSDAIGGVVSITTKKGDKSAQSVSLESGRYATERLSASSSFGSKKLYGSVSIDSIETDGIPARTTSTEDHPFENDSANLKVGGIVGKADVALSLAHSEGNSAYQGFGASLDQDTEIDTASLQFDMPLSDYTKVKITLAQHDELIQQNQDNFLAQQDFTISETSSIDWLFNSRVNSDHTLVYGLALESDELDVLSFGAGYEEEIGSKELFIQDEIRIGAAAKLYLGARLIDNDLFGRHSVGNAEFVLPLDNKTDTFSIAYGTAFKAPNASDLYGFGANQDLEPEESRSAEMRFRHVLNKKSSFAISAFSNRISNLISTEFVSDNGTPNNFFDDVFQNLNVNKAENQGIEVAYSYDLGAWSFDFDAVSQNPKNSATDTLLLRRSKLSYKAQAAYNTKSYFVRGDIQNVGDRIDFGGVELDSYTLGNISFGFKLNNGLTLGARVENIGDVNYEVASTFNTQGRSSYLTLSYQQ